MTITLHADPVPLRVDDTGTIRVGQSRVTLDVLLQYWRTGMKPDGARPTTSCYGWRGECGSGRGCYRTASSRTSYRKINSGSCWDSRIANVSAVGGQLMLSVGRIRGDN